MRINFRGTLRLDFFFLLLFNCYLGLSQIPPAYFHELNIDGQPFDKAVNVLYEDSIGFLWIGTNNGLYRYDGIELVAYQYDFFDQNSIPNNSINSIVEDNFQNLWIGSESYLIHFNRKQEVFKGYYKNSTVAVLAKSKDGAIWANRKNIGIVKLLPHAAIDSVKLDSKVYNNNSATTHQKNETNSFVQDVFGRYWLSTMDGIFSFEEDAKIASNSFDENIIALKLGPDQSLYALTLDTLYVLGYREQDNTLEILEAYPNFESGQQVDFTPTSLDVNPIDYTLWIGTTDGLLKGTRTEKSYTFQYYGPEQNTKGSLNNKRINSVILDHYGNLWIGSFKGVNKYIDRNSIFEYQQVDIQNNFENKLVTSLYFDKNNTLWVGVDNAGLYTIADGKSTSVLELKESIGAIRNDYQDEEIFIGAGSILLKSRRSNLISKTRRFDTIKVYQNLVMDMLPVTQEETWVGLWEKGIDIIDSESEPSDFEKSVIDEMKGNHVSVLYKDSHNNIWVGTRGEGLYKINVDGQEIDHYLPAEPNGLSSNAILSLLEVEDKIWIGTRGGGLNVYDPKQKIFESYGKKQGLRSTTISSLVKDKANNIWVSTQNGLARFDMSQKRFVNFSMEDGVTESQFMFNSSATDTAEEIAYFGCTDGFFSVRTKNFRQTSIKPKTVITRFKILAAEIPDEEFEKEEAKSEKLLARSEEGIRLPYNMNNIFFEFSSLDLTAPHKNEYAYMLEGMNDYWVYTTASNRNANYNYLPPGEYTFKVKSSNSDGLWNEEPTELKFSISPPFWRSTIAYVIYIFLLFAGIWIAAMLIRKWYLLKQNLIAETVSRQKDDQHNRMKMVFFTDISHELRTPLTLIQGTTEKIIRQKNFTLSPLTAQRLHNNSLRMGALIQQIMDIRKFDVGEFKVKTIEGNISADIIEIKNAFNDFAKIYHIQYSIEMQEKDIQAWYDPEILEKILFNLLSNAFKFTPENGKIKITVEQVTLTANDNNPKQLSPGNYIKCAVEDNGEGIAKKDLGFIFDRYYQSTKLPTKPLPGTGIGMELVQKLIDRHHGHIAVTSEENVCTEFTFMLPIQKEHYKAAEIGEAGKLGEKDMAIPSEFLVTRAVNAPFTDDNRKQNSSLPKIQVVDDNDELRAFLKEELSSDFCVLESSNGEEGYEMALRERPQLIISDILMPFEDGISLLKKLKKNSDLSHIPVLMLTARGLEETKIECLSLGADDFIEKPFSLEYVMWKVKNIVLTRKQLKEKYSKVITTEPSEPLVESKDDKFVKRLIHIIENSIDDDLLSVEFLASEVGMSRANLYRKLQLILNETPVNFIKQIRLKRAAQLLRGNNMYVSEVSYRVGFNNQKYFSKCFSKQFGMSPSDYAKKYADANSGKSDLSPAVKNFMKT